MKETNYIDSYEKLTIGKFIELEEVVKDKEADAYNKNIAIVSILTGIDEIDVYNLPLTKFNELLQLSAFMMEPPKKKVMDTKYKVGNYVLEPLMGADKMTTAQFVDYQNYIKSPEENLVELLSVTLVPKGHTYNTGYDLEDVQKAIREHLMVEDALAISAFFLLLLKASLKAMLGSLTRQLKRMKREKTVPQEKMEELEKLIQVFQESGDGLASLTR